MLYTLQSTIKLRDGNEMPILGFGTYELNGKAAYDAVYVALEIGYRHIDSAEWYENEKDCGQAILDFCAATNTPRSNIWYTSKLKFNNGYANVRKSIAKSLDECGLGYIDLYLIHGPIGGPEMRSESWNAICDAQTEGLIRSAGISTFGVRQMNQLLQPGVPIPAVNQIDLHPFMTRADIVSYCQEKDIVLEAWAPLVRGLRFTHPTVKHLAEKYGKEPAQVLLRYSLQKGFVPLPKSASKTRIEANSQIFDFELSPEEMKELDSLNEDLVTDWDPSEDP